MAQHLGSMKKFEAGRQILAVLVLIVYATVAVVGSNELSSTFKQNAAQTNLNNENACVQDSNKKSCDRAQMNPAEKSAENMAEVQVCAQDSNDRAEMNPAKKNAENIATHVSELDMPADKLKYADIETKKQVFQRVCDETGIDMKELEKIRTDEDLMLFMDHNERSGNAGTVSCYVEDTISDCDGPGFASVVLYSVELVTSCLVMGASPVVKWYNCQFCGEGSQRGDYSYFTSFFHDLETIEEIEAEHRICIASGRPPVMSYGDDLLVDLSFRNEARRSNSRYSEEISNSTRLLANYVLTKYFKPADIVTNYVEDKFHKNMKSYFNIGVHVRATDRSSEVKKVSSLDHWVAETKKVIRAILTQDDELKERMQKRSNEKFMINSVSADSIRIFLATDNIETILRFKEEFGHQLHWNDGIKAQSFNGELWKPLSGEDGAHLLIENTRVVLKDILMLSKCDVLVHGESSIAALAQYLNLDLVSYYVQGEQPGIWLPIAAPPAVSLEGDAENLLMSARGRLFAPPDAAEDTDDENRVYVDDDPDKYDNLDNLDSHICFARNRFKSQCLNTHNFTLASIEEVSKLLKRAP